MLGLVALKLLNNFCKAFSTIDYSNHLNSDRISLGHGKNLHDIRIICPLGSNQLYTQLIQYSDAIYQNIGKLPKPRKLNKSVLLTC
jgi:hypothetical protein